LGREALHQKSGKASFDFIYDLDDPREYFKTLGNLDYQIPHHGQRLFCTLVEALRDRNRNGAEETPLKVVDICCSYGVSAALLKHETTLAGLYTRYGSQELEDLSSEQLAEADAAFYGQRRRREVPLRVVGIDVARNAVSYGLRSNLLDAGFVENLEEARPTQALRRAVAGADLLTVTGGVGYISERTFERLLDCVIEGLGGRVPWVAAFALRWVSYERISEILSRYGLLTEKLAGHTFLQRRFVDAAEREYVLKELAKIGVDTAGREDEGWYHAHFYLSRPIEEAVTPLETLLASAL
jgi:hypothetical protein